MLLNSVGKNLSAILIKNKTKLEYIIEEQFSFFELGFRIELGLNLYSNHLRWYDVRECVETIIFQNLMSSKSRNIILFLFFFNFSFSLIFFSFCICVSFCKRCNLTVGVCTLATSEGCTDYCCFFFAHYFFLLLIYSNVSTVIFLLLAIFFLLANSGEAASCRHAATTITVILWRPCAAKPCAQWCQGSHLLRGDASPLFCHQGAVNAPIIL